VPGVPFDKSELPACKANPGGSGVFAAIVYGPPVPPVGLRLCVSCFPVEIAEAGPALKFSSVESAR
jgi:hypothetical protein